MKRKYFDGRDWTFMASLNSDIRRVRGDDNGWVAVVTETKVAYPLNVNHGEDPKTVFDDDFICISYMPDGEHWCISAVYDNFGRIVEWYVDILWCQGLTEEGVPYYDDLYLDVIVRPSYKCLLIDQEELQEALDDQVITQEQYDFAYAVAEKVMTEVVTDRSLLDFFLDWRRWIR